MLLITILLGTFLVRAGGYAADYYFSEVVSGVLGDYGEYDLLFTLASDKEDLALEQIRQATEDHLPGGTLKAGPVVAGSSNYLFKVPKKYHRADVFTNLGYYFADIPGVISKSVITEPRLSVRGFRGESLETIKPLIDQLTGIKFSYKTSDGMDLVLTSPEKLAEVKENVERILSNYRLLEVRYPLNSHPGELQKKATEITELINAEYNSLKVANVTREEGGDRVTMLTSLEQMKGFLTAYADRVYFELPAGHYLDLDEKLFAGPEGEIELKILDNKNGEVTALIVKGRLTAEQTPIFFKGQSGLVELAEGQVIAPRRELKEAMQGLQSLAGQLEQFSEESNRLASLFTELETGLTKLNEGLAVLKDEGSEINNVLERWQEEDIAGFLDQMEALIGQVRASTGDLENVQENLIVNSNQLRQAAGEIGSKLVFIPRNNELYSQLNELQNVFLQLSNRLDSSYEMLNNGENEYLNVETSLASWEEKIVSMRELEASLSQEKALTGSLEKLTDLQELSEKINPAELAQQLKPLQAGLQELQGDRLPQLVEQLVVIQDALPDVENKELIETIELIDSYLLGQVIPGDQIQLLVKGKYDQTELNKEIKSYLAEPGISLLDMEAGFLQPDPRGEVINLLRQVRAVIAAILTFVFTILTMMLDQSLIVSLLRLKGKKGYLYGITVGGLLFSLIYYLSGTTFPYLNIWTNIVLGGLIGLVTALLSNMLNPVSKIEWEAGISLGLSTGEIISEIMIPAGKPGLLYLLNRPKITFK